MGIINPKIKACILSGAILSSGQPYDNSPPVSNLSRNYYTAFPIICQSFQYLLNNRCHSSVHIVRVSHFLISKITDIHVHISADSANAAGRLILPHIISSRIRGIGSILRQPYLIGIQTCGIYLAVQPYFVGINPRRISCWLGQFYLPVRRWLPHPKIPDKKFDTP